MPDKEKQMTDELQGLMKLGLNSRAIAVSPKTVNEDQRSIDVILTTETKVKVLDFERWEIVDEILLSSGIEFNEQIPFLDSHQRRSIKDQLGSVRDISVKGKKTVGTAFFGTKQEAEDAFTMAKEGHLTDVSIGYERLETVFIEKGSTAKVAGREFKGPVRVTARTRIAELSATPIGADSMSIFRSAFISRNENKYKELEKRLKKMEIELSSARQTITLLTIKI